MSVRYTPTPKINLATGVVGNLPVANLGNGVWTSTTFSTTGSANDKDFGFGTAGNIFVEWLGGSDLTLTGVSNGSAAKVLIIQNAGVGNLYLANNSGSSSAGNKFRNLVTSSTTAVSVGGWICYIHDGTEWRMIGHDQGAYITPTFSAGDFTLSGDRTWTVDSGDVTTQAWKLLGRSLHYIWKIDTSTLSGGATSGFFKIAIPNSYSPTLNALSISTYILVGATEYVAYANIAASGTTVGIQSVPATADFGTSTNGVYVYGQTTFEVT